MGISVSITGATVTINDGSSASSTGSGSDGAVISALGPLMPGFGSATGSSPTGSSLSDVTQSYNKMMTDLSANGTPKTTLEADANDFESTLKNANLQNSSLMDATQNMVASLNDGTFSQQGSQGALEGAAHQGDLQGAITPQIDGNAGMQWQDAGAFDGNSAFHTQSGDHGSLGANENILASEIADGAGQSQIANNANALEKEATNAGDTGLAQAAQNVINSLGDGTYNAKASETALNNALASAPNAG
ncbi:hypothetical protein GWC77_27330 [Paraburkholderia sp. NMBU_R16]|uniref:hypothetical protein n=1 Tax=Paraburkholderia sp. NMBU_R16 TaxID=2698676 RepID=UPI001563E708|nr:hypothetical protein [Paraburkholderia sp. NMBU_R16]NRO99575.1 hypothetical protein [Paraburkholderia sp. NMBU_R16]